jgi:hypothetical protein
MPEAGTQGAHIPLMAKKRLFMFCHVKIACDKSFVLIFWTLPLPWACEQVGPGSLVQAPLDEAVPSNL